MIALFFSISSITMAFYAAAPRAENRNKKIPKTKMAEKMHTIFFQLQELIWHFDKVDNLVLRGIRPNKLISYNQ